MKSGRPEAPEAAEAIRRVYEQSSVGCCVHVQCDDGNLEDRFFDEESRGFIEPGHDDCLKAFELLRQMRVTARRKAVALARRANARP